MNQLFPYLVCYKHTKYLNLLVLFSYFIDSFSSINLFSSIDFFISSSTLYAVLYSSKWLPMNFFTCSDVFCWLLFCQKNISSSVSLSFCAFSLSLRLFSLKKTSIVTNNVLLLPSLNG